jgi:hypothetical protein
MREVTKRFETFTALRKAAAASCMAKGVERCDTAATSSRVPSCAVARFGSARVLKFRGKIGLPATQPYEFGGC